MNDTYILAIETSCDETSMAIVKNGKDIVGLTILTQMDTHANYGGVVPEIASRMHTENITIVLEETLKKAQMSIEDIDAIAVTYAPGLLGSLLVGVECAKTLAFIYNKPLIAVNHTMGHIFANNIEYNIVYPTLALIVSGGHTDLLILENETTIKRLGSTIDDSVGEVFDKVARVLGMPYPGGPNIEKSAAKGQNTYDLPHPMQEEGYNFSYSGLKSYIITHRELPPESDRIFTEKNPCDLVRELLQHPGRDIWICGGAGIIQPLVEADLIDKYYISVIPVILGSGLRLFGGDGKEIPLRLVRTKSYNGITDLVYIRRQEGMEK